jgi:hypothetical protein
MTVKHASPRFVRGAARCAGLACLLVTAACLDNELDPDDMVDGKSVFIAQAQDFFDYADWMTFERETKSEHGGVLGVTTIYVNELPETDPETDQRNFPIGAILFKSTKVQGYDKPTIHAMVKRGRGFNPGGALGWEYFELLLSSKGLPYILWRGADAPSGEQYQALLGAQNLDRPMELDGSCNGCHTEGHDGVLGDELVQLLDK